MRAVLKKAVLAGALILTSALAFAQGIGGGFPVGPGSLGPGGSSGGGGATTCAGLSDSGAFCSGTDAANLTGTVAAARLTGVYTFTTPNLGTPSAGVLTNATGLPISTGVSGLGTNVAAFLATPSSANLIAALTDETGTGSAVFASTPTLVTPILGVATVTSVNKVTITAPATSAVLTIVNGKTLTANNTLAFSGTDGSTLNVGAGGTLATVATSGSASDLGSGTLPSGRITGSYTGLTGTGTLTAGASGAGFTVALGTSTITTGAWTNYTPTVTFAGTCTGSVAGTPTGQYLKLGRLILFSVQIPIVTAGAACVTVRITVPFTSAAFQQSVVGRDPSGTGVFIGGLINTSDTTLDIYNYLGAYPAVNGSTLVLNGTYQAASD